MNPFVNLKMVRLHRLIDGKSTGTPAELARRFNCCERTVRGMVEQLKEFGLPIAYCKTICSYYYTEVVKVEIKMIIGDKEMRGIMGGIGYQNNYNKIPFF